MKIVQTTIDIVVVVESHDKADSISALAGPILIPQGGGEVSLNNMKVVHPHDNEHAR